MVPTVPVYLLSTANYQKRFFEITITITIKYYYDYYYY